MWPTTTISLDYGRELPSGTPGGRKTPNTLWTSEGRTSVVRTSATEAPAFEVGQEAAHLRQQHVGGRRAYSIGSAAPGYDPADLLKLYIYGYVNRVRSSRRLEAETARNLEVIWLLPGLRHRFI